MIAAPSLRSEYPLIVRDKIERLWRMAFGPVFPAPFSKTFSTTIVSAAAETHWWLAPSGGIDTIAVANCIAAYDAKNAASLALSYDNLASALTTYDLTLGVVPTWANGTGWTFDGTSQYLRTGIVPATGWSMMIRFANAQVDTDYQVLFGESKTGAMWFVGSRGGLATHCYYGSGGTLSTTGVIATGTLGLAGQQGYKNGLADGATISVWTTTTTLECYIGAYNSPNFNYVPSSTIIACSIYNTILSAATMALLDTAMDTL